ncbi:DUF932 domain-containing protein [Streptomyces sp. NPDC015125]|uniref:DUF932 domain-containing protein n=1 Tax=Streptomyces sp. NPDC015125 TaxID=3364938 RepID=UPI0036F8CAFB
MTVAALETPSTGFARRAHGRMDAWTELGMDVSNSASATQALKAAHMLDWNVRLMGNVTATANDIDENGVTTHTVEMPDVRATVRTNPVTGKTEYLGNVGRRYTPIQIDEHVDVLDLMAKESGATLHRAGAYQGGSKFFLSMTLPQTLRIGGVDEHNMHLALFGSHDGSSSNSFHIAPTRLDCGNMQRIFIKGAKHSYSIPHTASAAVKMAEVHKALTTLFGYQDAFEREAERMLNTPLSLGQFEKVVHTIWPEKAAPTARMRANTEARMSTLRTLFESAATQENIRGTAWAGWNAIGEYLDHFAPARNSLRAARSLADTGAVAKRKTEAYNLFALAA